MDRKISIGGKEVLLKASASTAIRYRYKFHRDLLRDLTHLDKKQNGEDANKKDELTAVELEMFLNLTYIMAQQADKDIPDDPWLWLDEFDVFPYEEVFPEVFKLWVESQGGTIEVKNTEGSR